jgi:proline dehydrogenase
MNLFRFQQLAGYHCRSLVPVRYTACAFIEVMLYINTTQGNLKTMWQKLMIYLARNEKIKSFFQSRKKLSQLASKFVGGKDETEALNKDKSLISENVYTSLFYLGEYVSDLKVVDKTMDSLLKISEMLSRSGLDIHISVDPTQVGLQIDKTICFFNLTKLAEKIKENTTDKHKKSNKCFLMIDMEDGSVCEDTITFYNQLIKKDLPIGLTLQAYLHRTEKDLQKTISNGGSVRLVKGAFAENRKIALTSKKEINQAFYNQSKMMLSPEAKKSGFYPIFATHDDQMVDKINRIASENNWAKYEYEFEMLYGVRIDYQKKLVKEGYKLRLYLPYGKDWWAYAIRRVGENPKNIKYLLRN